MTGSVTAAVTVIGGGQAGLAVARCLQRNGVEPVVLDAADRVGDAWRHRYDSLRLFTPAQYGALPDMAFPALADTYPSKDDVANYLADYAERFGIDIRSGCRVDRLALSAESSRFRLTVGDQQFDASTVVVATGALQLPWRPAFAAGLSADVNQMHAADYRNPSDVSGRRVLIVGAGNSGGQIAEELAADDMFEVTISFGEFPQARSSAASRAGHLLVVPALGRVGSHAAGCGHFRGGCGRSATDRLSVTQARQVRAGAPGSTHRRCRRRWTSRRGRSCPPTRHRDLCHRLPQRLHLDRHPRRPRRARSATTRPRNQYDHGNLAFIGLPGLHTKGSAFLGFVERDAEHIATVIGDCRACG